MTPDRLLDVATVARLFQVTHQTVKNWIKAGKLPGERTPGGYVKVRSSALAEFRKLQKPQIDSSQS